MEDLQTYLDKALKEVKLTQKKEITHLEYNIEKEVSELIVSARKELELTQSQLAYKSGVTQANISKIENESYCPSIAVLKRLATAMNKRLKIEFLDEEEVF